MAHIAEPDQRCSQQQTSQPGISLGTDHGEIDTELLGRMHYLFIGIPLPQDWFGLQSIGMHLFSNQRELRSCLALCRFQMDLNRFVLETQSVIERRRIFRYLKNMQ